MGNIKTNIPNTNTSSFQGRGTKSENSNLSTLEGLKKSDQFLKNFVKLILT